MKKIILFPIALFALVFTTSCDDQLDINTDPLAATGVDANLLFPEVLVNFSNIRESELDARIGSIVDHYEPANGLQVLGDYQQGLLSNVNLMNNVWGNIYTGVLKNVTLLEQTALDAEPGTQDNTLSQGQITKVLAYWQATMLWGSVPYTESVDFTTSFPKFDDQETILRGLNEELKEAVDRIDTDSRAMTFGDLVYGGDMEMWRRLANSMRLKILMQIANRDAESVRGEIAEVLALPLIETEDMNAQLEYRNVPGNFNPFWNILNRFTSASNNPGWYQAGEVCFNLLQDLNDPRLSTFYDESFVSDSLNGTGLFSPPSESGEYPSSAAERSILSLRVVRPDRPDTYVVASEIQLLKAEAIIRGYASGDAQAAMKAGIEAAFDEYNGIPGAVADTTQAAYIESLGNINDASTDDALLTLHQQLYIANFERLPDAWAEWRRTKVPTINPPLASSVTGVVRRFFYPASEVSSNPNAPSIIAVDTPMWYEN